MGKCFILFVGYFILVLCGCFYRLLCLESNRSRKYFIIFYGRDLGIGFIEEIF